MKKTLLMAAAALAAGVISSQAQPVYSQNVVGYANIATPSITANYLIAVPFKIGVSNGANEVFPNLPDLSEFLIWNPNASSYTFVKSDAAGSPATGFSDSFDAPAPVPLLPVGVGFFLKPSSPVTNTLVGTVAVNVGTSNVMTLPSITANYLVGCVVPYAGAITNGNNSGGGPNMGGLPDLTEFLFWDPNTSSYTFVKSDAAGSPATGYSDSFDAPVPVPTITVGQGFFVKPSVPNAQWITGLSAQ